MAKVKLASLLPKKKEKDVLMDFQKTKNSRDRKKLEERAKKKREASRLRYMKTKKNSITESQVDIRRWKEEIKDREAKIFEAKANIEKTANQIKKNNKKHTTKKKN